MARVSGSSHVEASGPSFRLSSDTPCISFCSDDDERQFHGSFRRQEQESVDLAAAAIRPVLASEGARIVPLGPDLPRRTLWSSPPDPRWLDPAATGPWVFEAQFGAEGWFHNGLVTLEIALAGPEPRGALEALVARLAEAVALAARET